MKTIPYSINEANGNLVMSLACNEDHTHKSQSPNTITADAQTTCETDAEEKEDAA
jgi:hypothetical protein